MEELTYDKRVNLLDTLSLGSSAAHTDDKLFQCKIETDIFYAIGKDMYDLIRGVKGSGKTALFRIYTDELKNSLLKNKRTIIVKGVEPSGDPVFTFFRKDFEKLTEDEFVDFWKIWIVAVVNEQFIKADDFVDVISLHESLVKGFREACTKANLPTFSKGKSFFDVVTEIFKFFPKTAKIATFTQEGTRIEAEMTRPLFRPEAREGKPIYSRQIIEALDALLETADLNVWVMVDRLDEIFPRRSEVEKNGLRALLRVLNDFTTERLKLKIFIRDDVFELIAKGVNGFTALDHLTARASDTLYWTVDEITHFIVKRVFSNALVLNFFNVDFQLLDKNHRYREETFYKVFPHTVRKGRNQSKTHVWLYNHCKDGLGSVTPRDIIELLKYARAWEIDHIKPRIEPGDPLFSRQCLEEGHISMSKAKKDSFFRGDFPSFIQNLERFEGQKAEHNSDSLRKIFGATWEIIAEGLVSIGFLTPSRKLKTYTIPFLYRPAFDIKQGKAYKE